MVENDVSDGMEDFEVDGVPADLLFSRCWTLGCNNEIPKERRGMYVYYCSDECEEKDAEHWQTFFNKIGEW